MCPTHLKHLDAVENGQCWNETSIWQSFSIATKSTRAVMSVQQKQSAEKFQLISCSSKTLQSSQFTTLNDCHFVMDVMHTLTILIDIDMNAYGDCNRQTSVRRDHFTQNENSM